MAADGVDSARGAVAVFVKTPGLSPLKTRLAAEIGEERALFVYRESLAAMRAVMTVAERESGGRVRAVWAVAEKEGLCRREWGSFPAMFAGEGGLGERLHNVYSVLRRRFGRAALLGADCPQIPPRAILESLIPAREKDAVVVPAADGGFCLFASGTQLPKRFWTGVNYSRADTLAKLLANAPVNTVMLPPLTDIDDKKTLLQAAKELRAAPLPEQRRLAVIPAFLLKSGNPAN